MKSLLRFTLFSLLLLLTETSVATAQSPKASPRAIPRTSWDDQKPDPKPDLPSIPSPAEPSSRDSRPSPSANEPESGQIAADLQALFDKAQAAQSVLELNSVIDRCRNVVGDMTRNIAERNYAKKLLSWAANRRGERRSDTAGELVAAQQLENAQALDRAAIDDFRLAIEYDPIRWRAHHNLGVMLAIAEDLPNAIAAFTKTIELNPQFVDAYHNRGEILFRLEKYDAAIADYSKAIEINDKDAALFSGRGNTRFALGQIEAALSDYQAAMSLAPDSAKAATEFADTCQSLGRWKEAAEAYQKAMKADPKFTRALQNAAWMMATCPEDFYRNPPTALQTAQRAIDQSNGYINPHLLHVLAMAHAANGDFSKAITTINQAIEIAEEQSMRRELAEHRSLFQKKKTYLQPARSP